MSEFSAEDALALDTWIERHAGEFELFLHAFDSTALEKRMLAAAARVSLRQSRAVRAAEAGASRYCRGVLPGTLLNPQRFDDTEL